MKHPAVGLVLLSALVGVPIRAQDTPLPIDPHADLTDLYRLMYPLTGKAGQTSSYDRNGGNADASFWYYLRGQPKRTVMADLRGPGVVSRIWVTAFDASAARIEIFVDGNSVPVISAFMRDFFGNGTLPPFLPPVSTYSTGSWVSYVPIPYHKSCRIEAVNARQDNNAIYYNITYRTLPPGEPMPPAFQMPPNGHQQNHLNLLTSQWNNRGQDPKTPQPGQQTLSGAPALPAQSTITLASLSGAGIVTGIRVSLNPVDADRLASVRLRCRFDGSPEYAVDAPVGEFFLAGLGPTNAEGVPLGMKNGQMYCYFPMPFTDGAVIQLTNISGLPISTVNYTITHLPRAPEQVGRLRFHAEHRSRKPVPGGSPSYRILDVIGRGHYLGCNLVLVSREGNWSPLEGDELIYVDGEATPSVHGTGTEDYFNGGFYFLDGAISQPFHGVPTLNNSLLQASMYRLHVPDLIPFRTGIIVDLEHGGVNESNGDYSTVAYYYRDDAPGSPPPDPIHGPLPATPLLNGGFENGFGGWTSGEANNWFGWQSRFYLGQPLCMFAEGADRVFAGTRSQKITLAAPVAPNGCAGIAQQVQVVRGASYEVTARLRYEVTAPLTAGDVIARLGVNVGGSTYYDEPSVIWVDAPATPGQWHHVSCVVTAQTDFLGILAGGVRKPVGVGGTATVWVDEVTVAPYNGPPPPPPLPVIDNFSFEAPLHAWQMWVGPGGNSDGLERDLIPGGAPDGSYVLAVKGFGAGGKGAYQYVPNNWVTGRRYRISALVRNLANTGIQYAIGYASGDARAAGAAGASYGTPVSGSAAWQTVWHEFDYTGDAGVTIYLRAVNAGASERAGFDRVLVEDITPGGPPSILRTPASFTHTILQGQTPAADAFVVQNTGGGVLNYTITDDAPWLSVSPVSGASSGEQDPIAVQYATAGLPIGEHTATISIVDPAAANSPQTIAVTVIVQEAPAPAIGRSPAALNRTIGQGQTAPQDQFTVWNASIAGVLNYTITDDVPWLSVSPASGVSTGEIDTITVSYATAGLPIGEHVATITIAAPDASNSPQTIAVTMNVQPLPVPGDYDDDGDVDQSDFAHFQLCMRGEGVAITPACADTDFDGDSDADSADLVVFLNCMLGPSKPGNPACAD